MLRLTVLALAATLCAPIAWADTPPASGQTASQPGAAQGPNPNARRCINDSTATGTRVPRRICRTNAEWAALQEAARNQPSNQLSNCNADRETCGGIGNLQAGGGASGGAGGG
jgi:hypothetical protein